MDAGVPYGMHSGVGTAPRFLVSCNHPGDWQRCIHSKTAFQESTWAHEIMSQEGVVSAKKLEKERKNRETPVKEKNK